MSRTVIAYTVFGVYFTLDHLAPHLGAPSCEHSDEARRGKFCSDCGVKVGTKKVRNESFLNAMAMGQTHFDCNVVPVYKDGHLHGWLIGRVYRVGEYDDGPRRFSYSNFDDREGLARNITMYLQKMGVQRPVGLGNIEAFTHLYDQA